MRVELKFKFVTVKLMQCILLQSTKCKRKVRLKEDSKRNLNITISESIFSKKSKLYQDHQKNNK